LNFMQTNMVASVRRMLLFEWELEAM